MARTNPNPDLLSDVERDELTFEFLGEAAGCEAFFGTAEYALYLSPSPRAAPQPSPSP